MFSFVGLLGGLGGIPAGVAGQEILTIPELESLYRGAIAGYEEAFETLEVLTSQSERATQEFRAAQAAGDEAAANQAYETSIRLAPEKREAQNRVEVKAQELTEARYRLREAHALYLDELLARSDTMADPVARREVGTLIASTNSRVRELILEADPPVSLPPLADITIEPRDGRELLLGKAALLERSVVDLQGQFAYNEGRLAALLRDQAVLRRANDALADASRFGDLMVPVGPPTTGAVTTPGQGPPAPAADTTNVEGAPLTLEERIAAMEALQEEITLRIQDLQVRARMFRLRAGGGEWAQ
jgi:hypothetical protein